MQDLKALADFWPVILALIGFIVWLVRLEGRIDNVKTELNTTVKDVESLRIKHENLDSKVLDQLGQVRESLARLEGALGIKVK